MSSPDNCPVIDQAELASATAKSLVAAVKKLRRLQNHCQNCAHAGACPAVAEWQGAIDAAIAEVYAERSRSK